MNTSITKRFPFVIWIARAIGAALAAGIFSLGPNWQLYSLANLTFTTAAAKPEQLDATFLRRAR
jgi:hypothetical protein